MRKNYFILLIVFPFFLMGQEGDAGIRYANHIYKNNIKSVKFSIDGLFTSPPILNMFSSAQLLLSFDDLDGDVKNYVYTFEHCDINWQPTGIMDIEYIDGFADNNIDNYTFSRNTNQVFTHYQLRLPNDDMIWKLSGNYILKVYEDEDEKTLAITRRFVVVDSKIKINANLVRPNQVSKLRTHHELDFAIDYEQFPMRNPQTEIKASVLQNGRWDNAFINISPNFYRLNSVVFDYQDKIVFEAGREFRYADLRSFRLGTESIFSVDRVNDFFEVILIPDSIRTRQSFITRRDANGSFVIHSDDNPNRTLGADYADVLFILKSENQFNGYDLFLFGELSDWQLKESFKMVYNQNINSYVVRPTLKQGYYEYYYVMAPKNRADNYSVIPDHSHLEGNVFEAENEYTIIAYYRPLGSRYDQAIGFLTFSTAN